METKFIAITLTLLLLASVFSFGLNINRASAQSTATLSIPSVSETPSALGTTFTVPVQISDVNDLFGFDINITWNNALITLASLTSNAGTVWPQGYFEPLPTPGYETGVDLTGVGYARYAAVATGGSGYTGAGPTTLFTVTFTVAKAGNFPYSTALHFAAVELSDQNANPIPFESIDGPYTMSATVPDINLALVNPNLAKPYEYGKYFEIQVYASDITSSLTGYDLKVDYTSGLLAFYGMYGWGTLGTGTVDSSTPGVVEVSISGGTPSTGSSILLFTLIFQIKFGDSAGHIWTKTLQTLSATVSLDTTYGDLSFSEGTLYVNGTGPTPILTTNTIINLTINLIQGDVECNGDVSVLDLRAVAVFYGAKVGDSNWAQASMYDLNGDGIVDIYDLVLVATNFGYYVPDSPP
jgi:hypothetical protein